MRSIFNLGIIVAMAAVITSCGEAFQAKFKGEARIIPTPHQCDSIDNSPYIIEVRAQVAGNSMELTVLKFVTKANQSSDTVSARMFQVQAGLTLQDDTFFYVDNQPFVNTTDTTLSVQGTIPQTRDEIAPLSITLNSVDSTGAACTLSVRSDVLKKED